MLETGKFPERALLDARTSCLDCFQMNPFRFNKRDLDAAVAACGVQDGGFGVFWLRVEDGGFGVAGSGFRDRVPRLGTRW